eukprot:766696-Hanusia_phi.AAC.4
MQLATSGEERSRARRGASRSNGIPEVDELIGSQVDFWERNVDRPFFRGGAGGMGSEQDRDLHAGGTRPPKFHRAPHAGQGGGGGDVTVVVSMDHLLSDKVLATHFQAFGKVGERQHRRARRTDMYPGAQDRERPQRAEGKGDVITCRPVLMPPSR